MCAPIFFLIRKYPPTPPSASAKILMHKKVAGQMKDIKIVLSNKDFLLILTSYS